MPARPARRLQASAALLAAVVAATPLVGAHEFWISATTMRVGMDETAPFVIGFGERFPTATPLPDAGDIPVRVFSPTGDAVPLLRRTLLSPDGLLSGAFPGAWEPGLFTLDASLHGKALNYSATDFQAYLTRERLSSALSFRKALKEEDKDAREIVTMFAKTFVRVGSVSAAPRRLGTRIELLPVDDPTDVRVGDTVHIRLFFNNGPLPNAPVTAINPQGGLGPPSISGKTNGQGETDFVFSQPGVWLIRAVQATPRTAARGAPTEWESYWASLTITVRAK